LAPEAPKWPTASAQVIPLRRLTSMKASQGNRFDDRYRIFRAARGERHPKRDRRVTTRTTTRLQAPTCYPSESFGRAGIASAIFVAMRYAFNKTKGLAHVFFGSRCEGFAVPDFPFLRPPHSPSPSATAPRPSPAFVARRSSAHGCKCRWYSSTALRSRAMHPPPPSQRPPSEGAIGAVRQWRKQCRCGRLSN
jgi:hypothetical protein